MPRTKPPAWTAAEFAILDEHYPTLGIAGVTDLLPGRSWQSIYVMASKRGVRCTLMPDAPKAKLQGERLETAIRMHEEQNWSFARIGAEFGVSEAGACNAILIALCERKGFRPAERGPNGRMLPEGIERLRFALRKGYKGVDIQLRLALSAGRVSEERRRYNRELKAAGKALLPPPNGGAAYSGVRLSKARIVEVEAALLDGLGTLRVTERTGVSKTSVTRIRNRLIRKLRRKGECLPGCDRDGKRVRVKGHFHAIPDAARVEFRRLLVEEGMSARRAGRHSGIGGSNAHWMRQAILAELAAAGEQLPATCPVPARGPENRRQLAEDALYPTGRSAMAAFRHYAAEHGYPAARQKLHDDRAAAIAMAREEARRPKTFEEQLAAVASGKAQIVPTFRPSKAAPEITLGGVATGAL